MIVTIDTDKQIQSIKNLRAATNCGLKDGKDVIDVCIAQLKTVEPKPVVDPREIAHEKIVDAIAAAQDAGLYAMADTLSFVAGTLTFNGVQG